MALFTVAPIAVARRRLHPVLMLLLLSVLGCAHRGAGPEAPPPTMAAPTTSAAAGRPEAIRVRMLVVAHRDAEQPTDGVTRTRDEALERARTLAAMARSGEALQGLVPTYSDLPGATEDLGVTVLRAAPPGPASSALFERALALAVGVVSEPVEVPQGFVVLERLADPASAPEQIAARHILIAYAGSPQSVAGATRSQEEARALAEEVWKQATAEGADFPALAARYTDEPGGKERGGDLRRFGRGQMVPAFERAAFALAVGQVSAVIESPFGFHIILRYE